MHNSLNTKTYNPSNLFARAQLALTRQVTEYSPAETGEYPKLLKTGSLDIAIREFSLAKPSWYMSHYTIIYKNGERMRDF